MSDFPPLTGETQSPRWPTTSIVRVWSGENEICAPPFMSAKGCGSPPPAETIVVAGFSLHVQRENTPPPSPDQRMKCPDTPTFVKRRGLLPSPLMAHTSSRPPSSDW